MSHFHKHQYYKYVDAPIHKWNICDGIDDLSIMIVRLKNWPQRKIVAHDFESVNALIFFYLARNLEIPAWRDRGANIFGWLSCFREYQSSYT